MKLSVVILNYNVRYFLELCLQSVEAALMDIDSEIIVVDNQSSDDSCEMVRSNFPNVKLIENNENYGFAKGNNIGVSNASGEYICILNPDTVVAEDTFTSILEFTALKKQLGIIGCHLKDGRGNFLPESKRNIPSPRVSFNKLFGDSEYYYANHLNEKDIGQVDILVGAFMILKRNLYDEVGGFDERYFMYGEDIDLSYTIKKAGYTNYYFGQTSVIHFKGESTLKDKKYLKRFYGAMSIFYEKHYSGGVLINSAVKFGAKLFSNIDRPKKTQGHNPNEVVSFSELSKTMLSKFKIPYRIISSLSDLSDESMLILDVDSMSFKSIIESVSHDPNKPKLSFRIWPKNSNFILGSDSNLTKGEILRF